MEAIKRLEFEPDFGNCNKLYDYVHRQEHLRPEDGWNLVEINEDARLKNFTSFPKKYITMTKLIEKSHREAGLLEKDPKRNAIEKESKKITDLATESEEIAVNDRMGMVYGKGLFDSLCPREGPVSLPSWVLPVYLPGDMVRGWLHLELSEPLPAKQLIVEFIGRAEAVLSTGDSQDIGREPYVEEMTLYWHNKDIIPSHNACSGALPADSAIPPGQHCFKYEYQIPRNAPPSVPPLVSPTHGDSAFLTYFLKATLDKGNTFKRGNIVHFRGIWVEHPVGLANYLENIAPFTVEQVKDTGNIFGKSGNISCTLKFRGKVEERNESLPITIEINNQSSEVIKEVVARFDINGTYTAKESKWRLKKNFHLEGVEVREGPVPSGTCPFYRMEVPLEFEDFVDKNLVPLGDLSRCTLIKAKPEVYVELKRSALKRNVKINIPIDLPTSNLTSVW